MADKESVEEAQRLESFKELVERCSEAIVAADCATSRRFTSSDQALAVLRCLTAEDLWRLFLAKDYVEQFEGGPDV